MPRNDRYRRYLEAAAALGEITRARAEQLVKDLTSGGDAQRAQAQQWVDDLVERGRDAAGDLVDAVRTEVSKQLQGLGLDPEDLARQAADIMRRSAEAGRRVVRDVAPGAGSRAQQGRGGVSTAAKTAAAKKAAAAKKTAAAKTAAKATAAKATAAKKTAAPTKTAPKKTAAAKKTAAPTKTAPTKAATAKKSPTAKKGPTAQKSPANPTGTNRSRTAATDAR